MNTKKEIINTIKQLFASEEEGNFVDVKTLDGLILRADDIQKDYKVSEVTEDGLVELEDGEYELEGGAILIVESGIIIDIKDVEQDEEEIEDVDTEAVTEEMAEESVEEEVVTEEMAEEDEVEEEVVEEAATCDCESISEMVAVLAEEMEAMKMEIAELKEMNLEMSNLKSEVEKFAKLPSEEPLNKKYNFKDLSRDDKLKALRR